MWCSWVCYIKKWTWWLGRKDEVAGMISGVLLTVVPFWTVLLASVLQWSARLPEPIRAVLLQLWQGSLILVATIQLLARKKTLTGGGAPQYICVSDFDRRCSLSSWMHDSKMSSSACPCLSLHSVISLDCSGQGWAIAIPVSFERYEGGAISAPYSFLLFFSLL